MCYNKKDYLEEFEETKFVYMFTEKRSNNENLVGGKGANLGQMTKLGLPIPQGFTVSTNMYLLCKQ